VKNFEYYIKFSKIKGAISQILWFRKDKVNATARKAGSRIYFVVPPGCIESALSIGIALTLP
jgi:hypothetical protein